MYDNPEQAKLASLIISIVILIIIVVLIVVVCCNWNSLNTNANVPIIKNPQKAALGAYAYNQKNNFDAIQRAGNIQNAKQYPGGASDWANFIQAGTAKTAAQNMQNNFGKVYTNCHTTGKGQVVCTQYVDTPKNQLMGYNHQRLANIQNSQARTDLYDMYGATLNNYYQQNHGNLAKNDINKELYYFTNHHPNMLPNNAMWQDNHGNLARKNINNALMEFTNNYINGGTGSNWANYVKNDQARTDVKNIYGPKLNNYYQYNNGNLAKSIAKNRINDAVNYQYQNNNF